MSGPKILTLDLENSPHLVWTWGLWNQNISIQQLVKPASVFCWAGKWHDGRRPFLMSDWEHGHEAMIQGAFTALDTADVVVTYNGDKHDLPHLHREFELLGLGAPSPYVSVDLYKVVKRETVWASHKLAYITEQLGLTGKLPHTGFQMWLDVMDGDAKAQRLMAKYNKQDVVTTEELFDLLRHRIKNLPNAALWLTDDGELRCSTCQSADLESRGFQHNKTRSYRRFFCRSCRSWLHETRSVRSVPVTR